MALSKFFQEKERQKASSGSEYKSKFFQARERKQAAEANGTDKAVSSGSAGTAAQETGTGTGQNGSLLEKGFSVERSPAALRQSLFGENKIAGEQMRTGLRKSIEASSPDETTSRQKLANLQRMESQNKLDEAQQKIQALKKTEQTLLNQQSLLGTAYANLQSMLEKYQQSKSDVDARAYLLAAEEYAKNQEQLQSDLEQYQKDAHAAYGQYTSAFQKAQKAQTAYEKAWAEYLDAHPYEDYLQNQENMRAADIQALLDKLDKQMDETASAGMTIWDPRNMGHQEIRYTEQEKMDLLKAQYQALEVQLEKTKGAEWEQEKREEILSAGGQDLLERILAFGGEFAKKGRFQTGDKDLKALLNELLERGYSKEQITNWFEYADRLHSVEQYDETTQEAAQFASEHPVLSSIGSVPLNLLSGVGTLDVMGQQAKNLLTGSDTPVNYKTAAMQLYGIPSTIRGQVASNIEEATAGKAGSDTALGNLYSGGYQLVMSMADSLGVMGLTALGVPAAATLLGGSAATSAMAEAKERGATDAQALMMGLMSGAAETFFEDYSIEKLFSLEKPADVKSFFTNLLKQAIPEASEEFNTTLANTLSDAIIMGDKSELATKKRDYMLQGMTAKEAGKQAGLEWFLGLMSDALGGAISGGLFAMGSNFTNMALDRGSTSENGGQTKANASVQEQANAAETTNVNTNPAVYTVPHDGNNETGAVRESVLWAGNMQDNAETQQTAAQSAGAEGIQWAGNKDEALNGGNNNESKQEHTERGTDSVGNIQRGNSVDATESAGDQSTEWNAERERRESAASDVNDYVQTLRNKKKLRDVTTASLKVTGGVTTDHVGVIQTRDETEQMRTLRAQTEALGIDMTFVTNPLTMEISGRTWRANGEHKNGRIIVQVNNSRMDMEQATNHEVYHALASKDSELVTRTMAYLNDNYSQEDIAAMVKKYEEIYSEAYAAQAGMTEETVSQLVLEEILADAYADYQRFENADARKLGSKVREQAAPVEAEAKQRAESASMERNSAAELNARENLTRTESETDRNFLDTVREMQSQRDSGEITEEEYRQLVLDYVEGEAGDQRLTEDASRFSLEGHEDEVDDLVEAGIWQAATMESVREVTGQEFPKGEKKLTEQVGEYFDTLNNKAVNPILGEVLLSKDGVGADIAHGIGRKKAATFMAVPNVIEEGGLIDYQEDWKNRGYDTAVIAAPITIDGNPYMMGVVLTRKNGGNQFYVHEVLTESEEGAAPFWTGTIKDGTPGGDTPSVLSLLQKVLEVKKNQSNFSVDTENSETEGAPIENKDSNTSDDAKENTSAETGEVLDGDDLTEAIHSTEGGLQGFMEKMPKRVQKTLERKMKAGAKLLADGMWTQNSEAFQKSVEEMSNTYMEIGTIPIDMEKRIFDELYPLAGKEKGEKRVIRNDFRANVRQLMSELKEVRAYAAQKVRGKTQNRVPEDVNLKLSDLWKLAKQQKRNYERTAAEYLLSDYDRVLIGQLLRGEISTRQVPSRNANKKGVIAVYEEKQLYEDTMKQLRQYKLERKAEIEELADGSLIDLQKWKDKSIGLAYSITTMEQNVYDIAPSVEIAEKMIRNFFEPVHKNTAKATRLKNELRNRIKKLELGRKAAKGNKLSEAAAVQLLGEAQENVEILKTKQKDMKRDGKTLEEWQAEIANLWLQNPNLDQKKIENAVEDFRKIYDQLFEMMNETRMRNGYEPVNYRRGYFPHFQHTAPDGILAAFGKVYGVQYNVTPLPTTIAGRTKNFKPGIQWVPWVQQRTSTNTIIDAVEGFDQYIEGVADVIYHTDDIQRLRTLAERIRYNASDEGLKKQAALIKAQDKSQGAIETELEQLYAKNKNGGRFKLSKFAEELDEYINVNLANKKADADRKTEKDLGRWVYNFAKSWEGHVASNMVSVNPASWLTNYIPLTQAWGAVRTDHLLHGMASTVVNDLNELRKRDTDGIVDRSTFLTNRRGSGRLVEAWTSKASSIFSSPMEWIDNFVSDSIVRARFFQNVKQGLSEEAALDEADAFAASVMADRSKGALPTIFARKNGITKVFTMFQVEQVNQFQYYFKTLPREAKKKNAAFLVAMLTKVFFGAWLYNELYEKLVGRRPAFDPAGMVLDVAQDISEGTDRAEVILNAGENLLEEVPFIGGLLGGGRVPISSALPDVENILNAAFKETWDEDRRKETIKKEGRNFLLTNILPFGGGQIKKIVETLEAVQGHGSYSSSGLLQYPVFTDDKEDRAETLIKGLLFGKTSTEGGVIWAGSGFPTMSEKYTSVYKTMLEMGVTDRTAYETIKAVLDAEAPEGESDSAWKRKALQSTDVSGDVKFMAYYGLLANEKEQELMDSLDEEDPERVFDLMNALKDAAEKNDKWSALLTSGLSEEGRETVWEYLQGSSEEALEKTAALKDLMEATGISVDEIVDMQSAGVNFDLYEKMTDGGVSGNTAYTVTMALREAEDANGTDQNLSDQEKYRIVLDNVTSERERVAAIGSLMQESQRATFESLMEAGLTSAQYVDYRAATDGITSDKDEEGNAIPGSKKEKVLAAIDSLKISDDLKTALYFVKGYKESTLDDAPWVKTNGLIWAGS